MFTPSSTASTIPGDGPDPSTASSSSVAGRLLTTFASTAAMPAAASSPGSVGVTGTMARNAVVSPCAPTAATTTPSARTNTQNSGDAARTTPSGVIVWRASARAARTSAPAVATQTGSTPRGEDTPKPTSVSPSTTRANRGVGRSSGAGGGAAVRRSSRNHRRSTPYSTAMLTAHGSAISAVNPRKDRPEAVNARRLVRFETGSSVEDEFARCPQA